MRKGLLALSFGVILSIGSVTAEAMPAGGVDGTGAASDVILVSGGCGIAFHRGPYGGCRPNGFYRPYAYGYGRPIYRGYGWHRGWHHW